MATIAVLRNSPAGGRAETGGGMNGYRYDFEKPIAELEHRLQEAQKDAERERHPELVKSLEVQLEVLKRRIYGSLTPWPRVPLARHPHPPHTLHYLTLLFTDVIQ